MPRKHQHAASPTPATTRHHTCNALECPTPHTNRATRQRLLPESQVGGRLRPQPTPLQPSTINAGKCMAALAGVVKAELVHLASEAKLRGGRWNALAKYAAHSLLDAMLVKPAHHLLHVLPCLAHFALAIPRHLQRPRPRHRHATARQLRDSGRQP